MKLAWAVSGQGMTARAVMEAHLAGLLASKLDCVIFDRTDDTASMIEYCNNLQIPIAIVRPDKLETDLLALQSAERFDCMGLTFNRIVSEAVIDAWSGRIFNLHLSLLPSFPGFGATRKALAAKLPETGVTVHFVDAGVDTGPIISQAKVPILPSDDEAALGRRQFEAALPLAMQTVRKLERRELASFDQADPDLCEFAANFARRPQ